MVAAFRVARYRFDLEAVDELHMPAYQGSTFRGGFGHAFKKMVCFQPNWGACTPCARGNDCPYGYVFETTAPPGVAAPLDLHEITPPFVIEAPHGERRVYRPGERLGFDLLLVGRGITYLPYFLMAFQELGRVGVGKPQGRYVLQRISALHPWRDEREVVFDGVDVRVGGRDLSAGWADVAALAGELPGDRLTLRFRTPTRIKYRDSYIVQPAFHVLVRALLRRISALCFFHCGEAWGGDARALIGLAEQVATERADVRWVDWDRFSGRQQQRVPLGGFVGELCYAGDLAPFQTLLALGSLVHVGKATVFGHGRYQIVEAGLSPADWQV